VSISRRRSSASAGGPHPLALRGLDLANDRLDRRAASVELGRRQRALAQRLLPAIDQRVALAAERLVAQRQLGELAVQLADLHLAVEQPPRRPARRRARVPIPHLALRAHEPQPFVAQGELGGDLRVRHEHDVSEHPLDERPVGGVTAHHVGRPRLHAGSGRQLGQRPRRLRRDVDQRRPAGAQREQPSRPLLSAVRPVDEHECRGSPRAASMASSRSTGTSTTSASTPFRPGGRPASWNSDFTPSDTPSKLRLSSSSVLSRRFGRHDLLARARKRRFAAADR